MPRIEGLARDERLTRRMSWVCSRELLGVCAPWPCLKSACGRRADSLKQNRLRVRTLLAHSVTTHTACQIARRQSIRAFVPATSTTQPSDRYGAFARAAAHFKTRARPRGVTRVCADRSARAAAPRP